MMLDVVGFLSRPGVVFLFYFISKITCIFGDWYFTKLNIAFTLLISPFKLINWNWELDEAELVKKKN